MRMLFPSVLFALAGTTAVANAQACVTVGQAICGVTSEPRVATTTGDVRVSRGGSFVPALNGSVLSVDDRIFVGNGAGTVHLGGCRADLKPYSVVRLSNGSGGMCVMPLASDVASREQVVATTMQFAPVAAPTSLGSNNSAISATQQQGSLASHVAANGDGFLAGAAGQPPNHVASSVDASQSDPYRGLLAQAPTPTVPVVGIILGVGAGAALVVGMSLNNGKERTASP